MLRTSCGTTRSVSEIDIFASAHLGDPQRVHTMSVAQGLTRETPAA